MTHLEIVNATQSVVLETGFLEGTEIIESGKTIAQLQNVFANEQAREALPQQTLVYSVQAHLPVKEGTEGGLFYGTSTIYPGKVDNEYFMTRGHLHSKSDRAEYYWGIQGEGMLLLMDSERNTRAEKVIPGSLHYIGADIAHRLANIGDVPLVVGACWPSDAGHNYAEIDKNGFSARMIDVDGKPTLIQSSK